MKWKRQIPQRWFEVCNNLSKASAASGFCSRPASRDSSVHGAVLPPLHLLPLPGTQDRHAKDPDERSLFSTWTHHCGVQEPGQDASLWRDFLHSTTLLTHDNVVVHLRDSMFRCSECFHFINRVSLIWQRSSWAPCAPSPTVMHKHPPSAGPRLLFWLCIAHGLCL